MGSSAGVAKSSSPQEAQHDVEQAETEQNFHEMYDLQQILGEGAFARVYKAQHVEYQVECAVKIVDLRDDSHKDGNEPESQVSSKKMKLIHDFEHERCIWNLIGEHKNTVRLYDSSIDTSFGYLVTEFCSSSLLQSFRNEPDLNEYVLARYFKGMFRGTAHLHSVSVIHRDIKQDNFMVGGPDGKTVKMCDFGLSIMVPENGMLNGVYGTAPYMAPEMLQLRGQHSFGADVWSLAVLVYSQFFGTFPYNPEKKNATAMKELIRQGDVKPRFQPKRQKPGEKHISSQAMAFVQSLLIRDPVQRPSANVALTHEYMTRTKQLELAARLQGPLVSLMPMLHSAVREGAYGCGKPQENTHQDKALDDLQKSSKSYRGASKHRGSSFCSRDSSCSTRAASNETCRAETKKSCSSIRGASMLTVDRQPSNESCRAETKKSCSSIRGSSKLTVERQSGSIRGGSKLRGQSRDGQTFPCLVTA